VVNWMMMLIDAGVVVYIHGSARRESYLACSKSTGARLLMPSRVLQHKESRVVYYVHFHVISGWYSDDISVILVLYPDDTWAGILWIAIHVLVGVMQGNVYCSRKSTRKLSTSIRACEDAGLDELRSNPFKSCWESRGRLIIWLVF
jgi:hypothetical protein